MLSPYRDSKKELDSYKKNLYYEHPLNFKFDSYKKLGMEGYLVGPADFKSVVPRQQSG